MTELVKRNVDSWTEVLPAVDSLSKAISNTDFVPEAMRGKPAVVAAAILYGRELGLEPMIALRSINVIKGTPSVKPEAMRGMVLAAGHDLRFPDMTAARCVVEGRRAGSDEWTRVIYTMDDAKKAGLSGANQYSKYPRQMLAARATSELCRLIFADVVAGLLTDADIDDGIDVAEAPTPATTAKRRTKVTAEAVPEPVIEDEIVIAEVVEDEVLEESVQNPVQPSEVEAEVIEEPTTGPALLRAALKDADLKRAGTPRQISQEQMAKMMALFNELGIRDRERRLNVARSLSGRDTLDTSTELSMSEASLVIQGLEDINSSPEREALLGMLP